MVCGKLVADVMAGEEFRIFQQRVLTWLMINKSNIL